MKTFLILALLFLSSCKESEQTPDGKWSMKCISVNPNIERCEYINGDICYVFYGTYKGGISCKFKS